MQELALERLDGERTLVDAAEVDELRHVVGSQLVLRGDPGYDGARKVWNGMFDRYPAMVVRCRGVADVVAAVQFARRHDALVAVRGGGHNVAGFGTCDGGIVIDLSAVSHVQADPDEQTVLVGGGATWGDVDRETQLFGQAVPGGIVSTTGVAGLTLGGGQGWLRRTFGMTSDSLLSAEVVTAEGEAVKANASQNPELFWALRGGGGNFGVVTSFKFRTHAVGPMIAFAGPAYPLESAPRVMATVRDFMADAPEEVNLSTTWWSIPRVEGFPQNLHGRPVIIVAAVYVGPPEAGDRFLRPLREIEEPLLDMSGTLPYAALQKMFDPFFPADTLQYYWKSIYLSELSDDVVETVARYVETRPSEMSMASIWALGGAMDHFSLDAGAVGERGEPYLLEILGNWSDPADSDANVGWVRDFFAAIQTHSSGKTNLNFPGSGNEPGFTQAAYGEAWDRLVRAKQTYDPENVFRLNQNVVP